MSTPDEDQVIELVTAKPAESDAFEGAGYSPRNPVLDIDSILAPSSASPPGVQINASPENIDPSAANPPSPDAEPAD
jgi:hypothetical protein